MSCDGRQCMYVLVTVCALEQAVFVNVCLWKLLNNHFKAWIFIGVFLQRKYAKSLLSNTPCLPVSLSPCLSVCPNIITRNQLISGAQIWQNSMSHVRILRSRRVTKFCWGSKNISVTVQNFRVCATRRPKFVHIWSWSYFYEIWY
jgi:hypothetical protein